MDTPGFLRESSETPCERQVRINGTWTGSQTSGLSDPESNSAKSMAESQAFATREDVVDTLRSIISYNHALNVHLKIFSPRARRL